MTATAITNNKQGTVELSSNGYGEQKTNNEASWYTWTYDGVTYKAAKLCISAVLMDKVFNCKVKLQM